jgi:hypothetical protein
MLHLARLAVITAIAIGTPFIDPLEIGHGIATGCALQTSTANQAPSPAAGKDCNHPYHGVIKHGTRACAICYLAPGGDPQYAWASCNDGKITTGTCPGCRPK